MLTDADKAVRERRLGASEVAPVLGISPFAGPLDPWARIMMGITREDAPELTVGHYLEPAILNWYHDKTGANLASACSVVHPQHDWLSATPDALAIHIGADAPSCVECKTARNRDEWGEDESGDVPIWYAAQCQIQMAVTGLTRCDVPVLFTQAYQWGLYVVHRDDAVIDAMIAQLHAWWRRHIEGGEMPALDGGSAGAEVLRRMFPHSSGTMAQATDAQAALVRDYAAAKARESEASDAASVLRQRLIMEIGTNDGLTLPDGGRVTFRESKAGTRSLRLSGLGSK